MLIACVLYWLLSQYAIRPFFAMLLNNMAAIRLIISVLVFAGIAMFFWEGTRKVAAFVVIAAVVLLVAVKELMPYYSFMAAVIALILSIAAVVILKKNTIPKIREQENLHWALKWALYIL